MGRPRKEQPSDESVTRDQVETSREETRDSRMATERRERVPLGGARQKLVASKREGFKRRWINDVSGRIPAALQAGYEFVRKDMRATTTDMGEAVSQVVGSKEGGGGLTAYLMEIREDWFNEDQAQKQKAVDAVEASIFRDNNMGNLGNDGGYLPKAGRSIG